ncbi:LysE family translocator [Pseudomonas oryzihabitans]|uniref:Threonine/homoserine/homoserine lactone efflux protein n=1 Tax=Pseudomonas oryzihabitans TaxID=47885 RepID=A0AAJ2BSP1_9PSED|nr:LysE family transporter [Pseudomonas psychrotolerans]MDR6236916.1 threonine/homoserine/homoserine lactone efflux protein [Pseudomonas psychrotolerans]
MTDLAVLLPFLLFCLIMTATPGPNNALVLASGAHLGVRRTLPLILGIALGVGLQLALLGLGLGVVLDALPGLQRLLGVLGLTYLLLLAWRIATSGPVRLDAEPSRHPGLLGGAAFQWLNPKAWTLSISAAATYIPVENHGLNVPLAAGLLATISIPCVGVWAVAGSALRNWLTEPRRAQAFNLAMATLLLLATLPPLYRVFTG